MLRKLSEYERVGEFNQIESALFNENNLTISSEDDFKRLFPDLVKPINSFYNFFKEMKPLKKSEEFVKEILSHDKNEPICFLSDNDADGIMSAIIGVGCLRKLGYIVYFNAPNRLTSKFGDQIGFIKDRVNQGCTLFITTDNGISGKEIEAECEKYGVKLIITDHHLPDSSVPEHSLIIDPKYNKDEFPDICGATVILKLCYSLYRELNMKLPEIYGDFAGIATITDMMPILNENRYLVKLLLQDIDNVKFSNNYQSILYKILRNVGGYFFIESADNANVDLISFSVGPAINAISRINGDVCGFIDDVLNCIENSRLYLPRYSDYNLERQKLTEKLLKDYKKSDSDVLNLFVYNSVNYDKPIKGVLGLIANRISNDTNKTTLIGTEYPQFNYIEFSGRSKPGYNLHEGVMRIKEKHPEIGIDGGGHANAMGIRITNTRENLEKFTTLLDNDIKENSTEFNPTVFEFEESMEEEIIGTLRNYQPFGSGFKNLKFSYTGKFKSYCFKTKDAVIGDFIFKQFLPKTSDTNGYLPEEQQKEITVEFEISFNGDDVVFRI